MPDDSQSLRPLASSPPANPLDQAALFSPGGFGSGRTIILFALIACWLLFFNELRDEWQVNPQYSFGYIVPLLGAMLLWRRWPDRPVASVGQAWWLPVVVTGLLLLQLPFNLALEANPEWRLLYWVNGFQV